MLYQVGPYVFEQFRLNSHEVERTYEADYAEKAVVGGMKPAEYMGPGDDTLQMTCKLFTRKQPGGLQAIAGIERLMMAGQPQICVRGDGMNLGWRRLTKAKEKHRYLDISGVGKIVEYELELKKTPRPSAAGMLTVLYAMAPGGLPNLFSQLLQGR